ncbi:MAG: NRDE family protein [Pseudomonadota bacterium]
MCLIIFAWQQRPDASLLLAANRDEFHARPSAELAFWKDDSNVLAGRDLEAHGTWLGVSRSGRFAAVTNVRDPNGARAKSVRSRGDLPGNFLRGVATPMEYLMQIAEVAMEYQGFNLLVGDGKTLAYINKDEDEISQPRELTPGVYGVSNASIDTPWPKLVAGKAKLEGLLESGEMIPAHESLRRCIHGRALASTDQLHDVGLKGEMAKQLSTQFIVTPSYGTRCSSTVRIYPDGSLDIEEQRFDPIGAVSGSSHFSLEALS